MTPPYWGLAQPLRPTVACVVALIATIESFGLTLRFEYDREKDMYTSYAYAWPPNLPEGWSRRLTVEPTWCQRSAAQLYRMPPTAGSMGVVMRSPEALAR